jgi:acetyl esterase
VRLRHALRVRGAGTVAGVGRDPEYLAFARGVAVALQKQAAAAPRVSQERVSHRFGMLSLHRLPVASVDDLRVDGGDGPLPARLYRPLDGHSDLGLVFFHGGGFYLGDVECYDPVCRVVAGATGTAVLSVGYRLAPENPFPAAVEDAYAATRWAARNADALGFDRIGVAGDSAGANLATVVAQRARDVGGPALAVQLLVYGVYDMTSEPPPVDDPDRLSMADGDLGDVTQRYLGDADRRHPWASPLLHPDLSGLPPTVLAHAGYDRLRPQGEEYAARLRAAGVPVTEVPGDGLDHAYLAWGQFAARPREAIAEIGAATRAMLAGASQAG